LKEYRFASDLNHLVWRRGDINREMVYIYVTLGWGFATQYDIYMSLGCSMLKIFAFGQLVHQKNIFF